jgi:hypothetical protein
MHHRFALSPLARGFFPSLEFEIDLESGDLRGRDAEYVSDLLAEAAAAGQWISHPWPTVYDLQAPRHSLRELSIVLGAHWQLPVELARAHPVPPDDESDLPLIY